jgi:hypothetical protein
MCSSKRRFEIIGVDGSIIFKWILGEVGVERVYWTYLAHDKNSWWAFVNTVMIHSVSIKGGEFLD